MFVLVHRFDASVHDWLAFRFWACGNAADHGERTGQRSAHFVVAGKRK